LADAAGGTIFAHGDEVAFELAAIRSSLANLRTFPFVAERMEAELLELHGLHFDIATGTVTALDEGSGRFAPIVEAVA
jgi:carbonic anhydrase